MEHNLAPMDSTFVRRIHFGREQTYVWDDDLALPFLPARSFTVDPSTVLQYLVTRPFVTMFLVDESGNGHDLGGSTLDTHAETPSPCE